MATAKTTAKPSGGKADATTVTESEPSRFSTATPWVSLVVRLGLAAMWFAYSVPKLTDISGNKQSVLQFQILSGHLATIFAYAQPYLELALGLLVLMGLGTRIAAAISGLLLLVYIGGIMSLAPRGIDISCGCGGGGSIVGAGHTHYILDVLRDTGYLIPAVWLVIWSRSRFSLDRWLLPDDLVAPPVPPARGNQPTTSSVSSAKPNSGRSAKKSGGSANANRSPAKANGGRTAKAKSGSAKRR